MKQRIAMNAMNEETKGKRMNEIEQGRTKQFEAVVVDMKWSINL